MTSANVGRFGTDDRRSPRLSTYQLSAIENQRLAEGLRQFQIFTDDPFPSGVACQALLARIIADKLLPQAAPGLNREIERARNDLVDCVYVTNLPTERSISSLLLPTLGSAIGRIFNYDSKCGNELVMTVSSDRRRADIHREILDWHTEGAWIPRDRRVEWICLLGVENSPGTVTAYTPIALVEQTISARSRAWLFSKSACFIAPIDAAPPAMEWSPSPRAVLSQSPLGHIEIVWPSYTAYPARPDDAIYVDALSELSAEINRQQVRVALDAGCLLAFNNCRGVFMHARASTEEYYLYYKTYARYSLRALQQATGTNGPIFSLIDTGLSAGA